MATCGGLRQIFDNATAENPSIIDPLSSWSQISTLKPAEGASFTEIFGELHFQEKYAPPPNSPPPPPPPPPKPTSLDRSRSLDPAPGRKPASNGGFSPRNSESLQLCTEGLGFESSADVDDLVKDSGDDWADGGNAKRGGRIYLRSFSDVRPKGGGGGFPPPITSINGRSGVCFKSYREDGRFVLREVRVPTQEFLRASREDGRLKLHFVHPSEEIEEEEKGDEQDTDIEETQEGKDGGEKVEMVGDGDP